MAEGGGQMAEGGRRRAEGRGRRAEVSWTDGLIDRMPIHSSIDFA